MRSRSPHIASLRDRLWGLVQRRAVLRATDREAGDLDTRIRDLMEQLRSHGMTPIEVQAELAEAEETATQLRRTLYKNGSCEACDGTGQRCRECEQCDGTGRTNRFRECEECYGAGRTPFCEGCGAIRGAQQSHGDQQSHGELDRWLATLLGTEIAVAVASADAYRILDRANLLSWQSGGCDILAMALCELFPGELYGLVTENGVTDHFVCKARGYFFDADGAYTTEELIAKHRSVEGVETVLESASESEMTPTLRRAMSELTDLLTQYVYWSRLDDPNGTSP